MTVIAWDGRYLVADRQAMHGDRRVEVTKFRIEVFDGVPTVAAWSGDLDGGYEMIDWYRRGAKREEWPALQHNEDAWTRLILCRRECWPISYETRPYPIAADRDHDAWGSGRDFALGALRHGASAAEAVMIAIELCPSCGMGFDIVDTRTLEVRTVGIGYNQTGVSG